MTEAASFAALASRFIHTESLPWIETSPGVRYCAIVILSAPGSYAWPSPARSMMGASPTMLCTVPLPKVDESPTTTPRP